MAAHLMSVLPSELLGILGRPTAPDYLAKVLNLVSSNKSKALNLRHPAGATWRIGDLQDTIYIGKPREVNGWGKFYLPAEVNMQVLGVVEGSSCPCDQLVLMTCEDKNIYAYDGEELHEVASGLQELCEEGIQYPANKSYYRGEAFKDMTEKDWDRMRAGPVGKRLEQAHKKLVTGEKSKFLAALKST